MKGHRKLVAADAGPGVGSRRDLFKTLPQDELMAWEIPARLQSRRRW